MSDGTTHINVYSKGKTQLGRELSNFAHTPFEHAGTQFNSVEAYWYWQSLKKQIPDFDSPTLRKQYGFAAKQMGRKLHEHHNVNTIAPSPEELKAIYQAKLSAHPQIRERLAHSTLPFDHYYEYNGIRRDTKWKWTATLWEELRNDWRP